MMDKSYEELRLSNVYKITDKDGNEINRIIANEDFVSVNFENYEFVSFYRNNKKEKLWRNEMLAATDELAALPDYPYSSILLEYRQELRDWTGTELFPNERPKSLEDRINEYKNSLVEENNGAP